MNAESAGKPIWPVNRARSAEMTASQSPEGEPATRDSRGRFLTGNNGGGRKRGSRNRLTETFLAAIECDFAEHGPDALERLRRDDPAAYLRIIASLLPRDLILQREQEPDFSDWTDDELSELVWRAWRSSQIRQQLEGVKR